ncbi:MAG TPA: OmpA family protein [Gemmatimonadales bacterium]|nr:OmpA family protein [Gemmatimonadales bacterium]
MKCRTLAALMLLSFGSAAAARAQGTGTFELGGFGQVSYFDRSLHATQARGGAGALLGFFLTRRLELQGQGAFVPTDNREGHVYYIPLRAHLLYNLPTGEHTALFLGAGYVHNEYRHDMDASDDGGSAIAGLRLGLRGLPSIRVATYVDYMPSPANGVDNNVNWGLQVGLSWLFGRNAPVWSPQGTPAARSDSAMHADSLATVRADSLRLAAEAARADSARAQAARDNSAAAAKADSVRAAQAAQAQRQTALRDSLATAARNDSIRTAALRDSLRLTRDRARMAALRDSLARVALRDSLRAMTATKNTRVTLRGVNFEINKAVLLPESRDILDDVARSLVANPEVTVEVAGHTDNTGPRALNDSLSLARAESVKAFLIEHGVEAGRMTVHGYAWDQPVASNKTASGRAQNRRVELRRTD